MLSSQFSSSVISPQSTISSSSSSSTCSTSFSSNSNSAKKNEIPFQTHHLQSSFCTTRPEYREGKKETAVKVYTINQESKYLLIQKVPALNLKDQLLTLCSQYGEVEEFNMVSNLLNEKFQESFQVKYKLLSTARYAKRKLDMMPFFGNVLHVCYTPEFETLDETREKLIDRRKAVAKRTTWKSSHPSINYGTNKDRDKNRRENNTSYTFVNNNYNYSNDINDINNTINNKSNNKSNNNNNSVSSNSHINNNSNNNGNSDGQSLSQNQSHGKVFYPVLRSNSIVGFRSQIEKPVSSSVITTTPLHKSSVPSFKPTVLVVKSLREKDSAK